VRINTLRSPRTDSNPEVTFVRKNLCKEKSSIEEESSKAVELPC